MRPRTSSAIGVRAQGPALRLVLCLFVLGVASGCRFPGSVRPTVKIGLVAPFEGRYRYIGYDVIYAVRLALREVNSAGGIGGYNVELVAYDDGGDVELAVQQARKLAIDPQVVAVIGHFRDETTVAALDVYEEAGLPLIAPGVLAPAVTDQRDAVFRLGPPVSAVAKAVVERIAQSGLASVVVKGVDGPLGSATVTYAERQELDVTASPPGLVGAAWPDGEHEPEVDVVVCDVGALGAGDLVVWLRDGGSSAEVLGGPSLLTGDFAAVAGAAAKGVRLVTPWPLPSDIEGSEDWRMAYQDMGPHVAPPGPLALPAYEATWLIVEALGRDLAAAAEPTRSGIAGTVGHPDRHGLLGAIVFDDRHDWADAPLYWYELGSEGVPLSDS